jgi:hypothetical protein
MSLSSPAVHRPLDHPRGDFHRGSAPLSLGDAPITWARHHLLADRQRLIQISLGLLWLLDGALQFQSYMYGRGFITSLKATALGQPPWVAESLGWAANTMQSRQVLFNTSFALIQIAIGFGLLHRRTVKFALAASFTWSLIVWWFGEGFGMLFMGMSNPLEGAPGAAVLYLLLGLAVWPAKRPGGLLGVRGTRLTWGALWLVMTWLWLGPAGTNANAISQSINGAPSGIGALTSLQVWLARATAGHGILIGLAFAALSAAIGIGVMRNWHARALLGLSIAINLAFWTVGQGFGGAFTGEATDPNSAPLLILLACSMFALVPCSRHSSADA